MNIKKGFRKLKEAFKIKTKRALKRELWLIFIFNLLDAVSTLLFVSLGFDEGNPIVRHIIDNPLLMFNVKLSAFIVGGLLLWIGWYMTRGSEIAEIINGLSIKSVRMLYVAIVTLNFLIPLVMKT